uniref:Uncharacterized protein n=1 Tax=Leviviridae sp. TaxID=2027243 RepID=A0A514DCR0_9VIRU|nr:MAG: hypothetical protein H1Rhizo25885e4861_000004 [Leviviridae sp.]
MVTQFLSSAQCKACHNRLTPGSGWFCPSCLIDLREKDKTIRYSRDVRPKSRAISVSKVAVKVRLITVQTLGEPRSGYVLSN